MKAALFSTVISCLFISNNVQAQYDMDDVLGGFDDLDDSLVIDESSILDSASSVNAWGWENTGSLSLATAWNYQDHFSSTGTDYKGLSKLRLRANWQADKNFNDKWSARLSAYIFHDAAYAINGRGDYTEQVLEEYETDIDSQEVYLLGKINQHWDVKIGRQVVIWGNADNLRVLDILNPLDNLEPGLADIEDLRLPVAMLKVDYYLSGWNLSMIAIPEIRFSKLPPVGSDFNYAKDFNGQPLELKEDVPQDWKNQNWALALTKSYAKWDLSLNAARYWQDAPTLDISNFDINNLPAALGTFDQDAYLRHSRIDMLGGSLQTSIGSWLFKTELAYFDGKEYTGSSYINVPGIGVLPLPTETLKRDQIDSMLGIEYFGIGNTTFALELVNRHIKNYEDSIGLTGTDENETEIAFRVTRNFINDRLDVTFVTINFNEGDDGSITRLDAKYEIMDGLNGTVGVLVYGSGDTDPLKSFADNDRVFAEIKWSF